MPKKQKTGEAGQHSFTNWAIAIVVILIGVMSVAIVALLAVTAEGGPDLKTLARPETPQSTATPQPRPTTLVWETPTPPMGFRPSFPTAAATVPAISLPTQPAQSAVADTATDDTAVSSGTNATNYIHPTYQPTTEPCSSCHEEIRPGQ